MKTKSLLKTIVIAFLIAVSFSSFAQNDIAFDNIYFENIAYIYGDTVNDGYYSQRPVNQILPIMSAGDITNVGTINQTDVSFITIVTDSLNNQIYSDTASIPVLNVGNSEYLECANYFVAPGVNNYTMSMKCQQAEIDVNPTNNIADDISFSISEERSIKRYNIYNDNFSPSQYGGGNGSSVELRFTLAEVDTIVSVSVFIDSTTTGGIIIPCLLSQDSTPVLLLEGEEYIIQNSDIGNWVTIPFLPQGDGNDILDPNNGYTIALELIPMTYNLSIGTDNSGYHDYLIETRYVINTGGGNAFVQYLEEIPLIDINLSLPDTTSSISTIGTDPDFRVYPNPATTNLNISIYNKQIQEITIYNQTGQMLKKIHDLYLPESSYNIDISDLPVGSYFVRVLGKDNIWAKKFLIMR